LSSGAEAVVCKITRTGQRSTNDVGGDELTVPLSTTVEFPDTFGGGTEIALFAGVDDAITTTSSEIQRRAGDTRRGGGRRRSGDERRAGGRRSCGDDRRSSNDRRSSGDHGRSSGSGT